MKHLLHLFIAITIFNINAKAQWQSTNGPTTWATVAALASNSTTVFASMTDGVHCYSGNTWSFPTNFNMSNSDITSFYVRGTNLFASFYLDAGVWLSPDSGANWTPVYNGLPTTMVGQLYPVYTISSSGITAPIIAGTEKGVYSTSNNGTNWSYIGLANHHVISLATHGNEIFAGTQDSGVFYSANNGSSWIAMNMGLTDSTILSLLYCGQDTIYAGTLNGIYRSFTNGTSWTQINNGLPPNSFPEIKALQKYGQKIIAGSKNYGVFMSTPSSSNWTSNNNGFSFWGIESLTIKGADLYAGVGQGGVWVRPLSQLTAVLEKEETQTNLSIFPNPAAAFCTIRSTTRGNATLVLYDITGRIITQQDFQEQLKLNTSVLKSGVYVVELKSSNSSEFSKLIIE